MTRGKQKIVTDIPDLKKKILAHKTLGNKIVCTIGSWDMLHIGHLRYLNHAKSHGDILVVGVDSDRGIKLYKNPLRPIVPQGERMEMLSYQDCIDYVTLIEDIDDKGNWQFELIKNVPMDVFITVEGSSYTNEQKANIQQYCKEVVVLPRQAQNTSSTDIIQNILKKHLIKDVDVLKKQTDRLY